MYKVLLIKINILYKKEESMKYFGILIAFVAVLLFSMSEIADAKRFGGSRSFGSKPSFSTTAPKAPSSNLNNGTTFNQRDTTNQANVGAAGAGAGAATASRGGFGLMGGLLAGTLLGSMLMGTPFAGGGLMDILLIGLLVYFGLRLFSSVFARNKQSNQNQQQQYRQNTYNQQQSNNQHSRQQASNAWDNLKSDDDYVQNTQNREQGAGQNIAVNEEFLEGAKTLFIRMQKSWDNRDLEDIKAFTSKAVFDEIQKQANEDPKPSQTLILSLHAEINQQEKQGEADRISVYFTALMREDNDQAMAENMTELWHFYRENSSSNWLLDGIQQV